MCTCCSLISLSIDCIIIGAFGDDGENRVEHTEIFNEYTKLVEDFITTKLTARIPVRTTTSYVILRL